MESKQFYTRRDKAVLWFGYALLALFALAVLLPLIYVVLASFIDPVVLTNQGISFRPQDWTLEGYRRVFQDAMIGRGFLNSFLYSTAFLLAAFLCNPVYRRCYRFLILRIHCLFHLRSLLRVI